MDRVDSAKALCGIVAGAWVTEDVVAGFAAGLGRQDSLPQGGDF